MTAAAARLNDPISHTSAMDGLLAGLAIGAGVALAGIAIAGTGGLAAIAIVGASASAGAGIGQVIGGLSKFTNESGMITSASPNVRINGVPAARAHADYVGCDKHDRKVIAEGSAGVRINGYPAARVGDRTVCDGKISSGSANVRIGGETVQTDDINPEVPAWLEWTVAGVGIASAFVLASPAVVALGLIGGLGGGAGGHWLGGELYGAGSDGQKLMMLGGSFVGGLAGAKGGVALNARLKTTPTNLSGDVQASSQSSYVSGRRQYLNEKFNRTGDINKDINIRGNRELALEFFKEQGMSEKKANDYLAGIDLSKHVRVEALNSSKKLWQYQSPGAPQGNWYSRTSGVTPDDLGINPRGTNRALDRVEPKILNEYLTADKVKVLKSSASPAKDFWSVRGEVYSAKGGGEQLFSNDKNIIVN